MLTDRGKYVGIKLSITNRDRPVLEWVSEATGIGSVQRHRDEGPRNAATWFWTITGGGAISVLRAIRRFLRIKPTQADLAISTYERLLDPAQKADPSWQEESRAMMHEMNRRGPKVVGGEQSSVSITYSAGG